MRKLIVAVAAFSVLGCQRATPDRGSERDTRASAAADSVVPAALPLWYRRARALDLTGDRRADSVRLDAVGAGPDSLHINLVLIVGGAVKHREDWSSRDELASTDSSFRGRPQMDAFLRARLDSVLSSVRVQRFDEPGVRLMAEDTAILAGLEPRPTHRISFSYGFETTVRLAWDAPRQRFVRLWSCC